MYNNIRGAESIENVEKCSAAAAAKGVSDGRTNGRNRAAAV